MRRPLLRAATNTALVLAFAASAHAVSTRQQRSGDHK